MLNLAAVEVHYRSFQARGVIEHSNCTQEQTAKIMVNQLDNLRARFKHGGNHNYSGAVWLEFFNRIGAWAIAMLMHTKSTIPTEQFKALLAHKNERYGVEPLTRWGHWGILMKIDAKISRMSNLLAKPELRSSDETLGDTLVDIVGYCVLAKMIMAKEL